LKIINQRDEKNSQMKNRKLVDDKVKKLKLSQKKQLEKERSDRNKAYQNMKVDLKRDSMQFLNSQKMSTESRHKLINNSFKQLYKNKHS